MYSRIIPIFLLMIDLGCSTPEDAGVETTAVKSISSVTKDAVPVLPTFQRPDMFITYDEYKRYDEMDRQGTLREDLGATLGLVDIKKGQSLADIGCGPGKMLTAFADLAGPDGTIWAVDVDQNSMDFINFRLDRAELLYGKEYPNIKTVLSKFDDPSLPPDSIDWAWLQQVHNFTVVPTVAGEKSSVTLERFRKTNTTFLTKLHKSLRAGGKMVIREMVPEKNPGAKYDAADLIEFIEGTGQFKLLAHELDTRNNPGYHYVLVFEKIDITE